MMQYQKEILSHLEIYQLQSLQYSQKDGNYSHRCLEIKNYTFTMFNNLAVLSRIIYRGKALGI